MSKRRLYGVHTVFKLPGSTVSAGFSPGLTIYLAVQFLYL